MDDEPQDSSWKPGRLRPRTPDSSETVPTKKMRLTLPRSSEHHMDQPCDREMILFDETEFANRDFCSEDPDHEFFETTEEDARKRQEYLRNVSEGGPLPISTSREHQRIVIRIVFPNRKVLQGIFRPAETIDTLYDFVRSILSSKDIDFYLFTPLPKVVLKDKQSTLHDNHLCPASKVYFGLSTGVFNDQTLSEQCKIHESSAEDADLILEKVL